MCHSAPLVGRCVTIIEIYLIFVLSCIYDHVVVDNKNEEKQIKVCIVVNFVRHETRRGVYYAVSRAPDRIRPPS